MSKGGKLDFSKGPSVGTSLADKLRAKGLAPAAPPEPPPAAPSAEPEVVAEPLAASKPSAPTAASPGKSSAPGTPVNASGVLARCGKVVVRMERKGHGGKTATVVDGVSSIGEAAVELLARRLARALGCGGRAEAGTVVLQGDQRERIEPLLAREGARRIVIA